MECDFCSNANPTWAFKASPTQHTLVLGDTETNLIDIGDGWAACDLCASLVRRNQRDMLKELSIAAFHSAHPEFHAVPITLVRQLVTVQHAAFWATKLDDGTEGIDVHSTR
jgi:hypothetical protein